MNTKTSAWLPIIILVSIVFWVVVIFMAVRCNKQEKEIGQLKTELNASKQKWIDFNKSYMPETALPRVPEIEATKKECK